MVERKLISSVLSCLYKKIENSLRIDVTSYKSNARILNSLNCGDSSSRYYHEVCFVVESIMKGILRE